MLNKIFSEIKTGKNIDLYILILCATFLVTVDIVGIEIAPGLTQNVLIVILALIAVSLLASRKLQEETKNLLSKVAAENYFHNSFSYKLDEKILQSKEIYLLGVSLNRKIFDYHDTIESILEKGAKVTILLVHPASKTVDLAVMRGKYIDSATESERIKSSMNYLKDLKEKFSNNFNVYLTEFLPSYETYIFDPSDSHGLITLRIYGFKTKLGDEPYLNINKNNKYFNFFLEEAKNIVDNAEKW